MTNLPVCDRNSKHWIDFICGVGGGIDTWFKLGIDGLRLDVADELTDNFIEKIHMAVNMSRPIEVFGCNDFQQYGEWVWNLINDSPEWVKNHKITRDEYKYGKMTYKSYWIVVVSRTHNITSIDLPDKYTNAKVVFGLKGCTKEQLKPYGAIALKNE